MDALRTRLDALDHHIHALHQYTHTVTRQLRWWRGSPWGLAVVALLGLSGCLPADRGWVREQLAPVGDRVARVEQQVGRLDPKVDRLLVQMERLVSRQPGTEVQIGLAEPAPGHRLVVDGATFAAGTTALTPAAQQAIDAAVQEVPDLQEQQVMVVGHTDSTGSQETNYLLGQRRAAAVAHYLLETYELNPVLVRVTSAGGTQPVADNATAEGRQQNRRVEILVYRDQGRVAMESPPRQVPRTGPAEVPTESPPRQVPRTGPAEVPTESPPRQVPRTLAEATRKQLVQRLRDLPKVPLDIVSVSSDGESQAFAQELEALFHTAGWATQGVRYQAMRDIPPGLSVFYQRGDAATFAVARSLQKTLHAVGVAAHNRAHNSMPHGSLMLAVASKPQ
jgi:outer membrane protein OmpA-like peptidoglycan-associated protein